MQRGLKPLPIVARIGTPGAARHIASSGQGAIVGILSSLVAGNMGGKTMDGKRLVEPAVWLDGERHFREGVRSYLVLLGPIVEMTRTSNNRGYTMVV